MDQAVVKDRCAYRIPVVRDTGEICIKIFCESNHNLKTNSQLNIVILITKTRPFWRNSERCIFFTHSLCDRDHFINILTPYIHVIQITQNFAVWTVERFSARFHSIRTGPGYLCRRTLTINLGPQA